MKRISGRRECRPLAALLLLAVAIAAPVAAQQDASRFYEQAVVRFEQGDLEGALLELKKALTADIDLLAGHILLARIYLSIGEGAAAEDALFRAARLGADPALTWPLRADALMQQFKFKELVTLAPESGLPPEIQSLVLVRRGDAYVRLNQFDAAERSYQQAVEQAPEASAPRVGLAGLALRLQDVDAADARSLAAVRLAPDDANAWNARGAALHAQGDVEGALLAYARAIVLEPGHYDARVARLGVLVDTGRRDEAEADIAHLRERYPLDARAAYLESVHLAQAGRRAEAREALERAAALLSETPALILDNSPPLELLAGLVNFELGAYEQAAVYLNGFIERFPDHPGARKVMGAIMVSQKRGDEAIQMLEPALRRVPSDARLLALLGEAYMLKGRHDIATTYMEKAIVLGGGSPTARTRLALSRIADGAEERGMDELAALFEDEPAAHQLAGLTLAVAHMQRGRVEEALVVAETLRELDPDNLTILNLLASVQLASGRHQEAMLTYEHILTQAPDFLTARINVAGAVLAGGRLEEARGRFEAILQDHPKSVHSMVQLAKAHEQAGQMAAALRWMQKAKETQPGDIKAAIGLVDLYLRMGEVGEALRAAEQADLASPENLDVLAAVGRAQLANERPDMALATFNRMGRVAGFDADALHRVAVLQLGIDDGPGAIYTLTKALQGDASHLPSRALLVAAQLRHSKRGEALAGAEALVADHPELPGAHRLLGDARNALGRHGEAIESYGKAMALAPGTINLLRLYDARVRAGDFDGARASLVEWLEREPRDLRVRLALAENHLALGHLAQAREHYELILETAPDAPGVLNNLAYILDKQGDGGALAMARRAHQAAPKDPAISDTLGWMLVRAGHPGEGLEYLRDARSRASANPEIRYHLAAALSLLGREQEALRELQQAIAYGTDFEGLEEARALLERLER
jgi:putative PEP-CTERM system TPR-repeat lipoprotein